MTKWIVFFVLTFVVNGAQKQDQPPPSKDLNAVLRGTVETNTESLSKEKK